MGENKSVKQMMQERNLDEESMLFASFIAGLNEFGLLNQMVMGIAGKKSGVYLGKCLKECNEDVVGKNLMDLIKYLNKRINISGDQFDVSEQKDGIIEVRIMTNKCRYCPKGVGGAELEGSICPFPGIIEGFVNEVSEDKIKAYIAGNTLVDKDKGFCVIKFKKIDNVK